MHHQVFSPDVGPAPDEFATLRASLTRERRFRLAQLRALAPAEPVRTGTSTGTDTGTDTGTGTGTGAMTSTGEPPRKDVRARRAASARMMLADVEAALARMDEGRYGICLRCSGQIPPQHLAVVPQARHCAPCQRTGRGRR